MNIYLKIALEIVAEQARIRVLSTQEMCDLAVRLSQVIAQESFLAEKGKESASGITILPQEAVTDKAVLCLECGKKFRLLTSRHLASHGLTAAAYRTKYGYLANASLVCFELQDLRSKRMNKVKIWEKRKRAKKLATGHNNT